MDDCKQPYTEGKQDVLYHMLLSKVLNNTRITIGQHVLDIMKSNDVFLGVFPDEELDFRERIKYVCNKFSKLTGLMFKV